MIFPRAREDFPKRENGNWQRKIRVSPHDRSRTRRTLRFFDRRWSLITERCSACHSKAFADYVAFAKTFHLRDEL